MRVIALLCVVGLSMACSMAKRVDRPLDSAVSNDSGSEPNRFIVDGDSDIDPDLIITNAIPLDDYCVANAGGEVVRSRGRYDIFCGSQYQVPFEVWNFLDRQGDLQRPRSEANTVQFERAEVQLMTPDDAVVMPTFSVPIADSVIPGDGTEPGKSVVFVEIIPAGAVDSLPPIDTYPQIVAQVQLFGRTIGDVDVETGVYRFPFELCDGCLTYLIDQCLWTDADIASLTEATGCQHGGGYDGSYCWCDSLLTSTKNRCEFCSVPAH